MSKPNVVHMHSLAMSKELFFQQVMLQTIANVASRMSVSPTFGFCTIHGDRIKEVAQFAADVADEAVLAHGPFTTTPRESI